MSLTNATAIWKPLDELLHSEHSHVVVCRIFSTISSNLSAENKHHFGIVSYSKLVPTSFAIHTLHQHCQSFRPCTNRVSHSYLAPTLSVIHTLYQHCLLFIPCANIVSHSYIAPTLSVIQTLHQHCHSHIVATLLVIHTFYQSYFS